MSESVYLYTLGLPLATILIVFAMRNVSAVLQARARAGGAAPHPETAAALQAIAVSLADVQARLAGIEKILKQVE
jgi:hypothetical protein